MSEVTVALGASNLGADLAERTILNESDSVRVDGFVKRWPPAVTIELRARLKELSSTTTARVKPRALFIKEFTRERSLCAGFAQNVKLLRAEDRTPLVGGALGRLLCHTFY